MSIGALTTFFSPDPTCLSAENLWQMHTRGPNGTQDYIAFGLAPVDVVESDCFPMPYDPSYTAYYSPGRCPSGYTAASSGTSTAASITETTHICCPTQYDFSAVARTADDKEYRYRNEFLCSSEYQEDGTMTVTTSSGNGYWGTPIAYTKSNGALNAYGIVVKFQESDFTSPKTMSSGSQPPSTITWTSYGGSTGSQNGSGGLQKGASIGIGVSVGLVALVAIVGGVYFLLRLRKKRSSKQLGVEAYRDLAQELSEGKSEAYELDSTFKAQELGSTVHHVPGSVHAPQELDGR